MNRYTLAISIFNVVRLGDAFRYVSVYSVGPCTWLSRSLGRDLLFVGPTKTFDIVDHLREAPAASEKSVFKPTEPMKGKPRPEGRKGRVQACRSWNPVL